MIVRYIGKFPPPFGGVTKKNQLLYDVLSAKTLVHHPKRMRFLPVKIYEALDFILALLPGQTLLVGLSSKGGKSRLLTKFLYKLNRRTMNRSLYFMMGGTEHLRIISNEQERVWYQNYKKIYVETKTMETVLRSVGFSNVDYYPNGRFRPQCHIQPIENAAVTLRCLFFAQISKEKGMDIVLEAAGNLPGVSFDIYGTVVPEYEAEFHSWVAQLSNVFYKGIYREEGDALYSMLNRYDIMLFPTKWDTEGVPGTLVEAKIAGITPIVSDKSYNSELVQNGTEGIVLPENTAEVLTAAIRSLDEERDLLYKLKCGSHASAERYYIENYTDEIMAQLG